MMMMILSCVSHELCKRQIFEFVCTPLPPTPQPKAETLFNDSRSIIRIVCCNLPAFDWNEKRLKFLH